MGYAGRCPCSVSRIRVLLPRMDVSLQGDSGISHLHFDVPCVKKRVSLEGVLDLLLNVGDLDRGSDYDVVDDSFDAHEISHGIFRGVLLKSPLHLPTERDP